MTTFFCLPEKYYPALIDLFNNVCEGRLIYLNKFNPENLHKYFRQVVIHQLQHKFT